MSSHTFVHKWTPKRQYQKTYKSKDTVDEVFDKFEDPSLNLADISRMSGVPYKTIQYWHNRYTKNKEYRPGELLGKHKRRFTQEQEANISEFITTEYLHNGIGMQRKHLRSTLSECWKSFDLTNRGEVDTSNYFSHTFIDDFCNRNRLSFRKMRKKKRSIIRDSEVEEYFEKRKKIFQKYPKNRIANMDETSWHYVYNRGLILAEKGTETVPATLPDDERNGFSVLATILANGTKLPPVFLAKGAGIKCHEQFAEMESDEDQYEIYHSSGRNTNIDAMKWYLNTLHKWMEEDECALILDRYTSHVSDSIQEYAQSLDIELVYIPTSATDKYQPLDRLVFGCLKSSAASKFNDKLFHEQKSYSKCEAADLFVELWSNLRKTTVLSAWDLTDRSTDELEYDSSDSEDDTLRRRTNRHNHTSSDDSDYDSSDSEATSRHRRRHAHH